MKLKPAKAIDPSKKPSITILITPCGSFFTGLTAGGTCVNDYGYGKRFNL
jgi:hypothetical protein